MADWKTQLRYSYNSPYHAYAYGLMYPAGGHEQNHANLSSWTDGTVTELGSYTSGVTQAYYAATAAARPREEPQPRSPEQMINNHGAYQGAGVVYLGGPQNSRLYLPGDGQHPAQYETLADDGERTRSETPTSDAEAHTSPDSWSSGSSREESLPQPDLAAWAKKEFDDTTEPGVPKNYEDLVSVPEPQQPPAAVVKDPAPASTPKTPSAAAARGKLRTTFSEGQMNTLMQRFDVQKYLTATEMKNLATRTGLTYKQVKTWFQNRRMKLRRHQKDTSWVSVHYVASKENAAADANPSVYNGMPPHVQPYQAEARTHLQQQYGQQTREAAGVFKNAPPSQNLAYYVGAGGGYPPAWAAVPSRPSQAPAGWPMAPAANHYDYSGPDGVGAACTPTPTADGRDEDAPARVHSPLHMAVSQ